MKWMEIIKVQTVSQKASGACRDYLEQVESVQNISGLATIRRYRHATVEGCQVVVLAWTSDPVNVSGSRLAQSFIHEMKRFGMVDHSVWVSPDSDNL